MDKEQRRKRMHPPKTVRGLPEDVRKELDERIARREFTNYRGLKRWLGSRGCQIATVAVRHHALKLEGRLEAVRLATEQARAVVEATESSNELDINQALMRLVQQHLFTLLVELKVEELTEVNLAALARTVATLARASVAQQKYASEMRTHVLAAQRTVADAEARGLTEEGVAQIKQVLMQITGQP
jgi:Protein of unknown function (DUF3486)